MSNESIQVVKDNFAGREQMFREEYEKKLEDQAKRLGEIEARIDSCKEEQVLAME